MVIDYTQIDHVDDARNQCEIQIEDSVSYIQTTILPFLDNFLSVSKDDQLWMIKEVVSFAAELNHLLKTCYELDINNSNVNHKQDDE